MIFGKMFKSKNFIEKYDNMISRESCEHLMNLFEKDPNKYEGLVGGSIDHTLKKSTSIDLFFDSEDDSPPSNNQPINEIIYPPLVEGLKRYKRKYPLIDKTTEWSLNSDYVMQRFAESEGYFAKHCEQEGLTSKRMLVWMFYLNDAKSGTRFYHQNVNMKAKAGRLVIWPAGWTHMHSGIIPNRGDKYMVTGWFSFY
jgi:hypothetical protein